MAGFQQLDETIDTTKEKKANELARKRADDAYVRLSIKDILMLMRKRKIKYSIASIGFCAIIAMMIVPETATAAESKRYKDAATGITFTYPTSLAPNPEALQEKPDEFTRVVFMDPAYQGLDVGSGYSPYVKFKIYPRKQYRREGFEDYETQTPLKGKGQAIVVGGTPAQKISYETGAPEAATDVIELIEIPRGDKVFLFDMRYGLGGCSNMNQAFRGGCEADNKKFAARAKETIDGILSSVSFK